MTLATAGHCNLRSSAPGQTREIAPGDDLTTRLRIAVAGHLEVDVDDIQEEMRLGEDLCLDSLAAVELLVVIENRLRISIPQDLLAGREGATFGDLVHSVHAHVGKG